MKLSDLKVIKEISTNVYLVKDKQLRKCVLKKIVIDREEVDENDVLREINIMKSLSNFPTCSNYVVCYYDSILVTDENIDEEQQKYFDFNELKYKFGYILMEYFEGYTILDLIKCKVKMQYKFTDDQIFEFVKDIMKTVKYIHSKGIVHMDIKAGNIMFNKQNIILIDFGNAMEMDKPIKGVLAYGTSILTNGERDFLSNNPEKWFLADIVAAGKVFEKLFGDQKTFMNPILEHAIYNQCLSAIRNPTTADKILEFLEQTYGK